MLDHSTVDLKPPKRDTFGIGYSRWKRKILSHVTTLRVIIITLVFILLGLVGYFGVKSVESLNAPYYFNIAYNFATAPIGQLASYNGRTNILLMGKAGGVHDGPDLTDTMMLISVSLKNHDIKVISIPRDIWIPELVTKINSIYYYGNLKTSGSGITFAKAIATEVVGVPIQYGAVIDFSGFKDVIDELGGIQLDVTNSFTDYLYPIAGRESDTCGGRDPQFMCRYETLTFNAGLQTMDGTTALKFVRSRHALGVEGTDLAREARQQKVIAALKNKLMDKKTYQDPRKDIAIMKVILGSVQTDIDYPTAAILARLVYNDKGATSNYLIPEELMFNPPVSRTYDMQSVFIPSEGSGKWDKINKWVESTLY